MEDTELEQLKYRLRIREVLLDKLVLAVLLGAAAFYANFRLKQYESVLSSQLEQLKSVYNLQRILDEREIQAHEKGWKAVSDFNAFVFEHSEDPIPLDEVQAKAVALFSGLSLERLYLTPAAAAALDEFFGKDLESLVDRWSGASGRGSLSESDRLWFRSRVDAVRKRIAYEIQAKRQPRSPNGS